MNKNIFKNLTERQESLDGLGLRLGLVQVDGLVVMTDTGRQNREEEGAEPILAVSLGAPQSLGISLLFNDKVEAKGFLAERDPLL